MHNFQDHVKTADLDNLRIEIKTRDGVIAIPETGSFSLKNGTSVILPFNMYLGSLLIKYATVQPFCSFTNSGIDYHVFWSVEGITPEIVFGSAVSMKSDGGSVAKRSGNTVLSGTSGKVFECLADRSGKPVHFLVIPMDKALQAYLTGSPGNQHLIISESLVLEDKEVINLISGGKEEWKIEVYPRVRTAETMNAQLVPLKSEYHYISAWNVSVAKAIPAVALTRTDDRHMVLNGRDLDLTNLNDVFVKFDYRGDRAMCFLNGELQTDNFCIGEPWLIGLKRYALQLQTGDLYFYFVPMRRDAPYLSYFDKAMLPDFSSGHDFLEIREPEIIPEYKVTLSIHD